MKESLIFWVVIDPVLFGAGSIGAYILIKELADLDRLPSLRILFDLVRRRWWALIALALAVGYFFYRLVTVMNA